MRKAIILVTALLLIVVYCSKNGEDSDVKKSGYPIKVEFIDGIKTIMNPNYPRDGKTSYKMVDSITFGPETGPEESILFWPYDIRVDSKDNVYINDAEDINIKIYDSNGNWIRNVGRQGHGPGEYTSIFHFDVSNDGRIFVLDSHQRRLIIYGPDGAFMSSFFVEEGCIRIRVDETNHIYFQQNVPLEITTGTSGSKVMDMILKRTDLRGKNHMEYGTFPYMKHVWGPQKTESGTRFRQHASREAHTTVWILRNDGLLYLGYSKDYLISILDNKGKTLLKFGRKFTPIKHPEYSPKLAHPKYYPAYYSRYYFIDDEENLWLKVYTEEGESEHIYDVFSPNGIYIQQAIVPHRIYQYQNGRAYTILELESRVYVAKRFMLISNES